MMLEQLAQALADLEEDQVLEIVRMVRKPVPK